MKHSPRPARTSSALSDSTHQRLNMYALAASAAGVGILAVSPPAEAKIVYTPAHRVIGVGQTIPLDLNHDGKTDFSFQDIWNTFEGSGQGFLNALPAQPSNGVEGFGTSLFHRPYAFALKAGNPVGPNAPFVFGKQIYMLYANATQGCHGSWNDAKSRYLGLKFIVKGKIHYGWARLNVSCNTSNGEIKGLLTGYAYETIANKSILTGKTNGPEDGSEIEEPSPAVRPSPTHEPVSLGLLALGAPAFSTWRRERQAAQLDQGASS